MILVNLLPGGRPRGGVTITPRQALLALLVTLSVATTWLGLWRVGVERAHHRAGVEWESLRVLRSQVTDARDRLQALERQVDSLARMRTTSVQWAPRLNLLSDAVVPGVWFTRLTVESVEPKLPVKGPPKPKGPRAAPPPAAGRGLQLLVAGTAVIPDRGEASPLAALLRSVKQQPDFARWFDAVELKSVERRKVGPLDVSDFVLRFEVREPSVSSSR